VFTSIVSRRSVWDEFSLEGSRSGLTAGIAADQRAFASSASAGDRALGGLTAELFAVAVLMTAACAGGLTRRLAEYR